MLYFMAGSVNSVSQTYWINSDDDVKTGTWHDTNDLSTGRRKYRPVDQNEISFFAKDDWKTTKDLTLNLCLRWDYFGSPYIKTGFSATSAGQGAGLFGVGRAAGGGLFDNWLAPGNVYLTGYGPNASLDTALSCISGVQQLATLPVSNCDPSQLTTIEFVGPKSDNPNKSAVPNDYNNFGPAIGFAYNVPWFGEGKTTVRGGYQVTFGGSGRVVGGGGTTASETVLGGSPGSLSSPNTVLADFSGQYLDLNNIAALVPVRPTSPALPGATIPLYTRNTAFSSYAPDFVQPYNQNFTLSVTRSVNRNFTVDVRYVGTVGKKQQGSFNLNTPDVYYNKELWDALDITRRGGDSPLLDQMLAGLNLDNGTAGYGPIGTCVTPPAGSTGLGQNGCSATQALQTASAALRRNATFTANLANGNFQAVAASLNGNGSNLPANGAVGGFTNPPTGLAGVGGRLLRNGCDQIASGKTTVVTAAGALPIRCFAENYITINPQLTTPTYIQNSGSSNYHSLQTQITMRPIHGMSYQATYTWAKNLAVPATTFTDPLNQRADYTLTTSDRRHDLRTNGTFELPIGPNKLMLGNSSGWLARVVERWQASIILNMTSGAPSSITAGTMLYANGVPDIVGPFTEKGHVHWGDFTDSSGGLQGSYFGTTYVKVPDPQCQLTNVTDKNGFNMNANASCTLDALALRNPDGTAGQIVLQNPLPGHRGTLGRNTISLPGTRQFDANLSKSFRITESKSLQFRMDATNVLNHPNVNTPNLDITTSTNFGQITSKQTNPVSNPRQFQAQLRFNF